MILDQPCLVMAYVIDTPSRRLESYIILTPADIGQRLDSSSGSLRRNHHQVTVPTARAGARKDEQVLETPSAL